MAQRYVGFGGRGLTLWRGRKLHVRTYAVVTGDLGVYMQRRAFLHVANKPFVASGSGGGSGGGHGDEQVHITNCCANSADSAAFAGEIVVPDLSDPAPFEGLVSTAPGGAPGTGGMSLARAFSDMKAILAGLVEAAAPLLEAQPSKDHFEYMGVDFMVKAQGPRGRGDGGVLDEQGRGVLPLAARRKTRGWADVFALHFVPPLRAVCPICLLIIHLFGCDACSGRRSRASVAARVQLPALAGHRHGPAARRGPPRRREFASTGRAPWSARAGG